MDEKQSAGEQKSKQQLRKEKKALQHAQKTAQNATKGDKTADGASPTSPKANEKSKVKQGNEKTDKIPENPKETGAENVKSPSTAPPVEKSKAELKAERRMKQEKQRAAKKKAQESTSKNVSSPAPVAKRVPDNMKVDSSTVQKKIAKKLANQNIPCREPAGRNLRLFSHLVQYEKTPSFTKSLRLGSGSTIHPAILHLGLQYAQGVIVGSNSRCIALLLAFKKVIADYKTPPQKELSRDLETKIKPYISFLNQCRPLAVSMGNAIKYMKWHIAQIPSDVSDSKAKEILNSSIDTFIYTNIDSAQVLITQTASSKIVDGDVILTYACSSLIKAVLLKAHEQNKSFRVIIVDGRPKMEGKELLRFLVKNEIKCSYVLINAVSYIMPEVTKVMMGAHGLQANGYVMSRIGSSQIALVAKSYNVPVLVCCETYKFCERVQADSFVFNELGDPNDLVCTVPSNGKTLQNWKDVENLYLLNLAYDVTSPNFVSAVITEKGMLPCTSVPVVLRVRQCEIQV